MSTTWRGVSKASPCPVCGKPDFCQVAEDDSLAMCRRAHLSAGAGGRTKVDKSGVPYTILGGRKSLAGATEYTGDAPTDAPEPEPVQHQFVLGEPAHLDTVYRHLFAKSTMTFAHEQSLVARGFTRDEIARYGYKSLPTREQWRGMTIDFARSYRAGVLTVPGFSAHERVDESGKAVVSLRLDGPPSLMLPVRDRHGRIVRVQLDVDREDPKYLPLTAYRRRGCRATQATHVPLHEGATTLAVRLVGGVYKADLATSRTGNLTLAAPSEYGYAACLDDVTAFEPAIVCIAPDADVRTNPMVAAAFAAGCLLYQAHGYMLAIETWPASCGKGIDDVIAVGGVDEIEVLTGARAWEFVRDVLQSSKAPPNPGAEARLALAHLAEEPESAAVFRPAIVSAVAQLDPASAEYQALRARLGDALGKGEAKTFDRAVRRERDRVAEKVKETRVAELEAAGRRIFKRVSDAALCQVVIDDVTSIGLRANGDLLKCVRGQLHHYQQTPKGIWESLDDAHIINLVASYDGSPVADIDGEALNVSAGKARGVLDLVKANRKDDTFFAEVRRGIAFANGFVVPDLTTGEMRVEPHNPANRARWGFDFAYEPGAMPKRYLEFLWRTCDQMPPEELKDTIACLTQHLGACLMGIATRFEIAIFCDGASGTGNSTILNIHKRVMPPGSVSSVLPHLMDNEFALANLEGALLNIADDLPRKELHDLGRLKSVVTGGYIEAGAKYEQNHGFYVVAGQEFACNGMPRVSEPLGMRRRSAILKFTSQVPEGPKNRWLDEQIVAEERAKIVSYALDALSNAIRQNRITVPKASDARVTEWLGEADSFERFCEDEVAIIPTERKDDVELQRRWPRAVKDVYAAYTSWCAERQHKPFGEGIFGKKLRAALRIGLEDWKKPPYHRNDGYHYPILLGVERRRAEDDATTTKMVDDLDQKGAWN